MIILDFGWRVRLLYQVVIVEDDPMVAILNRNFTEKDRRFTVCQSFQDGRSALTYLAHTPPDLVILDIYMPVFTGLELLRELRARSVETDVVMVTAANDTKTLDALMKLGVVDYLVKPFTYARFQQALDTFCQHRQAVSRQASVNQSEIDRLFSPHPNPDAAPKGLQEKTLSLIRGCLADAPPQGYTSEELSGRVGLSTVTIRRYLSHMAEQGEAESSVDYDTGGRPSLRYRRKGQ